MPEQYKGSNDCGIWVCNAIGAYLTQVVIRQRLLGNVKDRDISTDVGIIRGDFSGAEFECATFLHSNLGLWVGNII